MPGLAKHPTEDDYALVISQNLLKYRKLKGLTQTELGQQIGLSRSAIADFEAGRNKLYSDILARIARALGVSSDTILGFTPTEAGGEALPSLRFLRRLQVIETFPEAQKKRILRNLDDAIESQTRKTGAETPTP